MSLRRLVFSLALLHAALVCGFALAAPPAQEGRAAVAVSGGSAQTNEDVSAGDGIACRDDTDCPHLACGPCEAGAPITKKMVGGPECAVNPCLDASSVCSAEHRCEIGPRTRKNPAVWKRPPG